MKQTFSYSFTYTSTALGSDTVVGEAEVEVKYTFAPGCPAVMYLRNGDPGYPAEGPEIEIVEILIEDGLRTDGVLGYMWRPATADEFETYYDYAMDKCFDDMIEEVSMSARSGWV